ncbi:MAG: amino acid ABC transporter permease [Rhizobium sp.]
MSYTFHFATLLPFADRLLDGLSVTLSLAGQAIAVSFAVGMLGAVARSSRVRPFRAVAAAYVELIRNTPFIIQAFIIYFGLAKIGIRLSSETSALIALSLNGGAYLTEIIRGGLKAVLPGQYEAGRALGLSEAHIYREIVLLQAIRAAFPAIVSEFIVIFLGTSVCSIIAVDELTGTATSIDSQILRSLEIYTVLMAVYLAISMLISVAGYAVERAFLSWGETRQGASIRELVNLRLSGWFPRGENLAKSAIISAGEGGEVK